MTSHSVKAGIIGWPVSHSLSPLINATWRRAHGVAGWYDHLPCPDDDESFAALLADLAGEGYDGVNVTLPHKARAARAGDTLSDTARLLGVANTLSFTGEGVHADNTDAEGFRAALEECLSGSGPRTRALVLGAGGAAPAIALALSRLGFAHIDVTNRTGGKADALAARFDFVTGTIGWETFGEHLGAYDVIVNTTALGMKGQPPLEIDFSAALDHQVVADIIYTPLETPLLAAARGRGLRTMNGLAMLMHQAVSGFSRWSGVTPAVTPALRARLEDQLKGRVRPVMVGITGSVGMGKSTVAQLFEARGAALWNADEAVHRLYDRGGAAVAPVAARFPNVVEGQAVSRPLLSAHLVEHPEDFAALESIVHPLVAADRAAFAAGAQARGALGCVMDVPLLYENRLESEFDTVIVTSAAEDIQRARVLSRPGMTPEKLDTILVRQISDADKRARADHVIRTDRPMADTARAVRETWRAILEKFVY